MAEDLDDGEFWLPTQFLTDDDILSDFTHSRSFGSRTSSDLGSIETESCDDDDHLLLSGLPRQFSQSSLDCPVHSKGWVLSSSPQSTLFGCGCKGSSLGSPSGHISPSKEETKDYTNDDEEKKGMKTLDLLHKAAGEVAKMKMRSETGRSTVGTGFFDCSNSAKGLLCPPPHQPPTIPTHFPPSYTHRRFHHFAPMMWGPVQYPPPPTPPQQQNEATNNGNTIKSNTANGRPLGLPQSAWPPLPGQPQVQTQQPQPMMGMFVGQPRQKGTGVFLPRRVETTTETKKKPDEDATKTKSKGSQRRNSGTPKAIDEEIQLPPEWVY